MPSSVTDAVRVTGTPVRGRAIGSIFTIGGWSFASSSLLTCVPPPAPPPFETSTFRSIS